MKIKPILHVWADMSTCISKDQNKKSLYSQPLEERLFVNDEIQVREEGKVEYIAIVKRVTFDTYSGILFVDAIKVLERAI